MSLSLSSSSFLSFPHDINEDGFRDSILVVDAAAMPANDDDGNDGEEDEDDDDDDDEDEDDEDEDRMSFS